MEILVLKESLRPKGNTAAMIEAKTREEYWKKVYSFLETGYRKDAG